MPVHNQLAHIQACLTAFAENTSDGWYELLIVDNASTDGTREWLATLEGDVAVVTNQTNRGFAKACNQMAAQARGKYVVFLGTDTLPFPGWLEGLVAEAEVDETVGVVGGKLLSPDAGHVRHVGLVMGQEGYPVDLLRHAPPSHPGTNARRDLDMVTGACMLVRRDMFERLGGFDDTYGDGFEDVDLCLRVRMTGHKVRFTPHSLLYHIEGAAEGRVDRARDSVTRFQSQWSDAFDLAGRLRGAPMTLTPTPVPPGALPVRWEGDMFAFHSLAAVNRAIASHLVASGLVELEARPRVAPAFAPSPGSRLWALAGRVNQPLSQPAAVTVRHQWPPDFTPPVEGAFVVMQPWEYGGLPDEWVDGMKGAVDEMWVYTPWLKDCYIRSGLPAERVHVVPLGVDVDRFRPKGATYPFKTKKAFKFLFLGGALPRKGVDVLLNAYMSAFTSEDDVCLVIKGIGTETFYGHIPLHELIVKVVEEARRDPTMPAIEYLDAALADDDIAAMYRACDALVHPYRGEGFGLPVAEAMATGLPVIVTGLGACTAFCDEQTAYLIPAREVPAPMADQGPSAAGYWWSEPDGEALARLMRHVWEHPEEAREVALRGQQRIRDGFTWDHTARKVQERLAHLAAQTPRRR
jgi:GT2 family glycosyltransferase